MLRSRQAFVLLFVLFLLCPATFAASVADQLRAKIAPVFLSIIGRDLPWSGEAIGGLQMEPAARAFDGTPVYDAIIFTSDASAVRSLGIGVNSEYDGFVTARLRAAEMLAVSALPGVRRLEPGMIVYPTLDVSVPETGADLVQSGFLNGTQYRGKGAIVMVFDTGIDWKHPDFRDPLDSTKSRILFLWDQTLAATGAETRPAGFSYGVEYTKTQIENELDGTPAGFVREVDINGHGTHVMGIAAGNGNSLSAKTYSGMAPDADLIMVKGGNNSFSEIGIIDALTYAKTKATAFGKPIVINMSLGSQGGPHDGTRPYEVAVDSFVTVPGRVVCISAGNDGANLMHVGGNVSEGDSVTLTCTVPAYTPNSGAGNDAFGFLLYFRSPVSVKAKAMSPNGIVFERAAGQYGYCPDATDGTIYLDNNLASFNSNRYVDFEVNDADSLKPPKSGTWMLRITGVASSASWDGWLYSRTVGVTAVTLTGGDANKTVGMPGTSRGAITVASHVTKWGWPTASGSSYVFSGTDRTLDISSFSSIGPTGDGRQKPDISAPGQGIASSLSTSASAPAAYILPGSRHQLMSGTSMAAPHVTGAVGLLLGAFPTLMAADIKSLITTTANTDTYTGIVPNYVWGYGKLDILEAMAKAVSPAATVTRRVVFYDIAGSNATFGLTGATRYAVRFTAPYSGTVTGFEFSVSPQSTRPVVGSGNAVCEVFTSVTGSLSGIPGARVGNGVQVPFSSISPSTMNHVDMSGAGVSVVGGQDYHLVLSVSNPADTLRFRGDSDTLTANNRSSVYSGATWYNFADGTSGYAKRNLRFRAVVTTTSGISGVAGDGLRAATFELERNYPNPFNPSTTIRYSIPSASEVTLRVFDIMGREVTTLVRGVQAAGRYQTVWEGTTNAGIPVASGVYFCRLEAGSFMKTQRMLLLK